MLTDRGEVRGELYLIMGKETALGTLGLTAGSVPRECSSALLQVLSVSINVQVTTVGGHLKKSQRVVCICSV